MIDTIDYWSLDKNYAFFWTFVFAWILWWEWLGKIFVPLILDVLGPALWIEKLTHQPKEVVNQNSDIYEWKRRGIFLLIFYHPRFASGYDQNQLFITDVSKENRHRKVPKLMITVPKWNKRNNQRKLISHFVNYWTRITGWLTGMPKVIVWNRKPEKWLETELSISNRWRKEQKSDNIGNE